MMFDMEYLSKSKAPSSPKPSGTAKRPVLGRKRDTAKTSKVVNLEEFCARVVVDDLIQGALKDDARNAAEDLFFDEDEFPELVEKYDDYDEDDVVSLAGQSDSDEEELENFNLVCQVTKRAVKGAMQDDFHGIDFGKAVEDASRDASTADSTDGFCEVVDLSDEEVDSEGDAVPQTDIAPEAAPVKESVATSPPKFHMLPSVGTWMVPSFRAPVTPVPAAPEAAPVKESVATSPPKFHMLPSVGTWMVPSFRAPVTPVPALKDVKGKNRDTFDIRALVFSSKAPEAAPVKESVATSPPKFHMLPSVGTWMVPSFRAPVTPVPVAPPAPSVESSSAMRKSSSVTKMKRRIIGATVPAVARAPAESLPVDPAPPSGSRAGINWFLAGSVANGLRSQKEVMTFNMAEDDQVEELRYRLIQNAPAFWEKRPGLARKSSITAMFEVSVLETFGGPWEPGSPACFITVPGVPEFDPPETHWTNRPRLMNDVSPDRAPWRHGRLGVQQHTETGLMRDRLYGLPFTLKALAQSGGADLCTEGSLACLRARTGLERVAALCRPVGQRLLLLSHLAGHPRDECGCDPPECRTQAPDPDRAMKKL
ncbi:unnamed protein product [Cladocopium goreaui]|uniref:Calmodulin-like protein 6 n=1 Tax=Cladocopium goreaui TaxID=2562237 RepID=A0A9P1CGM7_9DINO|nr:unnamed protein product [Cladocopium goreaui]